MDNRETLRSATDPRNTVVDHPRWKTWRQVGRFVRPYWKLTILVAALSIILSLLGLVDPYLIKILVDQVIIPKNLSLLWTVLGIFVLAELASTAVGTAFSYLQVTLRQNVILSIRRELFEHLENLDLAFHKQARIGDMLYRLGNDVEGVEGLIETGSLMFKNTVLALGTFVVIFTINQPVAVFLLVVLPFYALVVYRYRGRVKKRAKELRGISAGITSFLQERLLAIKSIKIFQREEDESQSLVKRGRELVRAQQKFTLFSTNVNTLSHYVGYLPTLFVLGFGGYEALGGRLSLGGLFAIYAYAQQLLGPFAALGASAIQGQDNIAALDRVSEVLDRKPTVFDRDGAKNLGLARGEITFDHVSFQFPDGEKVVEDVSFKVEAGEWFAVVGPSGVGKTTIADLIFRFYDPTSGSVQLDGIDLRDISLGCLRHNIGMVTQWTPLYNFSIRENILYGRADATEEEVVEAAKLAGIHDFVTTLEKGYGTIVGERGVRLSEGQLQRMALARMFIKNPSVLILDEATSSLEAGAEENIHQSISSVMGGKTVLIIAHRFSTITNVDRILMLKEGRIIEQGTFHHLMERKGDFYMLFRQQVEAGKDKKEIVVNV